MIKEKSPRKRAFLGLSNKIIEFCSGCKKEVILLIDEVDKSSNNQLEQLM